MLHVCCFLMGKHEEREKFAKSRGRCEDAIKMIVEKGKGLRCVQPGNFDLGKRHRNALKRSQGPG